MGLSPAERHILAEGLEALGLSLSAAQLAGLGRYVELLDTWRTRANLVSVAGRDELLRRHVLDSLAAAARLQAMGSVQVLDVGSGAGLPGVPLAIACPAARVTLLEPRRKRVSFLRTVARECSTWNIQVAEGRAQDLSGSDGRPWDVVLSRATFPPARLPDEVEPLVAPGGTLIAYATHRTAIEQLSHAAYEGPTVEEYRVPGHPAAFRLLLWRRPPACTPRGVSS